jgi:hypothetical protein
VRSENPSYIIIYYITIFFRWISWDQFIHNIYIYNIYIYILLLTFMAWYWSCQSFLVEACVWGQPWALRSRALKRQYHASRRCHLICICVFMEALLLRVASSRLNRVSEGQKISMLLCALSVHLLNIWINRVPVSKSNKVLLKGCVVGQVLQKLAPS